jgi:hypothetical protein
VRTAFAFLLLPLAACAAHKQPSNYSYWAPKPPPAWNKKYPSYVPDRVDGSYQGTAALIKAYSADLRHTYWYRPKVDDEVCPHTTYGVVEIGDRTLYYSYAPNLVFAAPVASNGAITQTVDGSTLTGQVMHGTLTFSIVTPLCTTRFNGGYKLNHS